MADIPDLQKRFTYHPPVGDQVERYTKLRSLGLSMALLINELCPESREKSLALTKLEEVVMWANAAVAREDPPKVDDSLPDCDHIMRCCAEHVTHVVPHQACILR